MRKIKIPFYFTILSGILGSLITFLVIKYGIKVTSASAKTETSTNAINSDNCPLIIERLAGYQHIKPLLLVDQGCESAELDEVKEQ